jgi:hypothetical protein
VSSAEDQSLTIMVRGADGLLASYGVAISAHISTGYRAYVSMRNHTPASGGRAWTDIADVNASQFGFSRSA